MEKILTIVVPAYQAEKTLVRCLDSIIHPDIMQDIEVIIVNDGSVDQTAVIAQAYVDQYPQTFILINKENGGHGSGINRGIRHAKGKYFQILDSDDLYDTASFRDFICWLAMQDADLCLTGFYKVYPDKVEVHGFNDNIRLDEVYSAGAFLGHKDGFQSYFELPRMCARTALLQQNHIEVIEKVYYADYEYTLKVPLYMRSIVCVRYHIYRYMLGSSEQSVAVPNFVKNFDQHEQVILRILDFLSNQTFVGKEKFIHAKVGNIIKLHDSIALIYDTDRKRGVMRAKRFRRKLKSASIAYYRATSPRYWTLRLLHALGFDYDKLEGIKARIRGRR